MKQKDINIPEKTISQFTKTIQSKFTYLDQDSILIFVCGGQNNNEKPTARERFMQYAEKHLKHYQFFMAEKFFEGFHDPDKTDLLTIEGKLADFSDCVMIILESVGAFTELGAFANNDRIAKIILAVNNNEFKNSESFVSSGPLAKINKVSKFKPSIFVDFDSILQAVNHIRDRLLTIERKNKKKIELNGYNQFKNIEPRLRMLFLMDIITIFNPINHTELIDILTNIYDKQGFDINVEINMLRALGMLANIQNFYVPALFKNRHYYSYFDFDLVKSRSEIINHYHKYYPKKVKALNTKMGATT